jgi:PKD repeat protein
MKTPPRICFRHFIWLTALCVLTLLAAPVSAQGRKIFVGSGSGFIDYPNAQATLNLRDDDTIVINPGRYKLMNFRNITASPGHKIHITNGGVVEFYDPSPSTFSNLTNVEIRGNGVAGLEYGFYMHDLIRGISIDGTMSGVYFSYIKMVNIRDYCVFFYNPSIVYNGTNAPTSIYYDIKFLHFSVSNIMTTFLQLGLFGRVMDDGLVSMFRKLEVAYCTVDHTDQQDVFHLSKVQDANIHHNKLIHLGANDFRHTGIIYLYGSGEVHHNYISDYWGSGLRAHSFSLDAPGVVNIYNNVMVNSRKYSGIEVQCTPEDIAYSPYMRYCNFKVYNNTFGNLSAADWQAAMIDSYNAVGGTIEIKNNLGFNIQRDKPFDPARNYVYTQLNITKPDTAGNMYGKSFADIGLVDDSSCLLNVNSPAINKGVTLSIVKDDIDSVIRPQSGAYDIGAHEYRTGIVFPVSRAGADTSTILPKDSIALNGSASFNPTGGLLTYKWSQVSGPATALFIRDTSASPLVKNLVQGSYVVKLTVTNTQGQSNEDILVLVVSPVPVFPPVANAGGNTTITLPVNSTALNGGGSTNSAGGVLKYAWLKIAGPTSSAISGDTTVNPFLSSLTEGVYLFKLTVTNSNGLADTDTATVIVKPAPVPTANAGPDVHLVLPANSTPLNGGASTTPGGGALNYVWTKVSGPASFSISGDSTVTATMSNLAEGAYQVKLTVTNSAGITSSDFVNITITAAPVSVANAGPDVNIVLPINAASLNGSASYSTGGGALTYDWSLVSGPVSFSITGAATATPTVSNLVQGVYTIKLKVTNAEGSGAEDVLVVNVSAIPVLPPVCNAGTDAAITLPSSSVILNGDQSFNPGGGVLTYTWSKVSGPVPFTISGDASATPTLSNLAEGAYVVRLVVTNEQGASSQDEVTITVRPLPPSPPVASAGADIFLRLPQNSTSLNGTASSNAAGGTLLYAWSLVSGPAGFAISNQNAATASISNLQQGTYQVKLVVTNAQGLSAEDIVAVTVLPAVYPVAAAGDDIALLLPANSATLNGAGSNDPEGGALSYAWSKLSGPPPFTIAGSNTASPVVSNLTAGIYQVMLTVTAANGLTATDVVTIAVNLPLLSVPLAGGDTTVNFPNGYAVLNGSQSYGQNGATIVSYRWSQLSGPTSAVIVNRDAAKTTATSLEPGTYTFQLTITDSHAQTATTTFKVTVVNTMRYLKSLRLYPNPCISQLQVKVITDSTGPVLLRVTNLAGVVMMQRQFQKTQLLFSETLTVATLPSGMYVLEVIADKRVQLAGKFVKN